MVPVGGRMILRPANRWPAIAKARRVSYRLLPVATRHMRMGRQEGWKSRLFCLLILTSPCKGEVEPAKRLGWGSCDGSEG
jgi:hypothetical protein